MTRAKKPQTRTYRVSLIWARGRMNQTVEATSIADAIDQAELRAAMFDDGERGKLCGVSCRTLGDPLGALAAESTTLGAKPIEASLFGSGVVEAYLTGLAWGARERGRA